MNYGFRICSQMIQKPFTFVGSKDSIAPFELYDRISQIKPKELNFLTISIL